MWGCLTECSLPPSCSQHACERPDTLPATVIDTLATIQSRMLQTARDNVAANTHEVESYAVMKAALADAEERLQDPANGHMGAGFFLVPWHDDAAAEAAIKTETKATIRCYPHAEQHRVTGDTTCFYSGRPATHMALFARAY